jgi:hypothetical protein
MPVFAFLAKSLLWRKGADGNLLVMEQTHHMEDIQGKGLHRPEEKISKPF